MHKKEVHSIDAAQGFELFGAIGNYSYLSNHIDYFEKKIPDEINPYLGTKVSVLAKCHNFAAWVRLYTEYISVKMFSAVSRAEI